MAKRPRARILQKSVGLLETEWAIVEKRGEMTGSSNSSVIRLALMAHAFTEQLSHADENVMIQYYAFVGEFEKKIRAYDQSVDNPYDVELLELLSKAYPIIPNYLERAKSNTLLADLEGTFENIRDREEWGHTKE